MSHAESVEGAAVVHPQAWHSAVRSGFPCITAKIIAPWGLEGLRFSMKASLGFSPETMS